MPPLENTYCHLSAPELYSVVEGNGRKNEETARAFFDANDDNHAVIAQRQICLGTSPFVEEEPSIIEEGYQENKTQQTTHGMEWLTEFFGCTCISLEARNACNSESTFAATRLPENVPGKVAYPIAVYTDHLNSPALVERRRRSLMKHFAFRPVRQDSE
jgi:hypothetical protein